MIKKRITLFQSQEYAIAAAEFYRYLKTIGYVANSCRNGELNVSDFLLFMEQQNKYQLAEITTKDLWIYFDYLQKKPNKVKGGKVSASTICQKLRHIEHFFSFLQNGGQIVQNPYHGFSYQPAKQEAKERNILSITEIELLYAYAENMQERAMLSLAYGCGLRAGEIERLNTEDINFKGKLLIVQSGKGNKRRAVPMAQAVAECLEEYYNEERIYAVSEERRAFLLNRRGRRFREFNGNHWLKRMISRTGNPALTAKHITLHCLRHSIATHLIESGMDMEKVRDFLGHYFLETTEIYTHIRQKQINKLIENKEDDTQRIH